MHYSRMDVVAILLGGVLAAAGISTSAEPHKDWGVWFFGICTLVLLALPWVRGWTQPKKERVEFDEQAIRRYLPNGRMETIQWSELREIGIVTTDEGPGVDDVFWLFLGATPSSGRAVSNGAEGFKELLPRIQSLPGFDNEAVVRAMGSAGNDRFMIWRATTVQQSAAGIKQ